VIIKAKQNRIFIAKMTLEESLGLFYNPFIWFQISFRHFNNISDNSMYLLSVLKPGQGPGKERKFLLCSIPNVFYWTLIFQVLSYVYKAQCFQFFILLALEI
jgi:hypothetical protein